MRRLFFVVALIFSLSWGHIAVVAADGPLVAAAKRAVEQLARSEPPRPQAGPAVVPPDWIARPNAAAVQVAPAAGAGLSKGRKLALSVGALMALAAMVYAIDHKVEDNTPSHLGTRRD